MKKRAPQGSMVSRALAVLDPPPTERERCRKLIEDMLDVQEFLTWRERDELEIGLHSTQGKAALKRYVTALRKVKVCYAALNPSIQRFLAIEAEAIEHDIIEARAMSECGDFVRVNGVVVKRPRPSGQPVNKNAQRAVDLARFLLEQHGRELTTERQGKWHFLSQVFADTSRDLRHHLTASLAEKPKT
jgi:hypothetical protein